MSITFAAVICDADDPCSVNTQQTILNHSFTMSPRNTTRPLYFWNCGSNSEFLWWQRSTNDAKCTITSFLLLTFVSRRAKVFSSFSIIFHCCMCIWYVHFASAIAINLCTGLKWLNEFTLFPEMWSSWSLWRVHSIRILIHSSASIKQAYLVLCPSMARQVSLLLRHNEVLQSIAAGIRISNFLRAFFTISLDSVSSRSMKWIPRNLLASSSFGFSTVISVSLSLMIFGILASTQARLRDAPNIDHLSTPSIHTSSWSHFQRVHPLPATPFSVQHTSPYVGLTVHWAVSSLFQQRRTTCQWPSR